MDADSPSFAHAFEDLPAEARLQAAEIASTQPGISLRRRIREELETFGLDSYGTLEESPPAPLPVRLPGHAVHLPGLTAGVWRGRAAGRRQAGRRWPPAIRSAPRSTCARRWPEGDARRSPRRDSAGRADYQPYPDHRHGVADRRPADRDHRPAVRGRTRELTYVHCEAGRGRTGVVDRVLPDGGDGLGCRADALAEAVELRLHRARASRRSSASSARRCERLAGGAVPAAAVRLRQRDAGPVDRRPSTPRRTSRKRTDPLAGGLSPSKGQTFRIRYARHAYVDNLGTGSCRTRVRATLPARRDRGPAENGNAKVCEGIPTMSEQPAIQYAELLRQLRAELGLTQEELASAAGISPRTISDLERGINQTPRRATAELLADALRLTGPERGQFMAAARRRPVTTPAAVLAAAGTGHRRPDVVNADAGAARRRRAPRTTRTPRTSCGSSRPPARRSLTARRNSASCGRRGRARGRAVAC